MHDTLKERLPKWIYHRLNREHMRSKIVCVYIDVVNVALTCEKKNCFIC